MNRLWTISESGFSREKQHHHETIFTIGNGYLSTRGAFEEGYPGDRRSTFIHGVFDYVPVFFTELANAPDWLPLYILINGERFSLAAGTLLAYERTLDLTNGVLKRSVRWQSASGDIANICFERFVSLSDPHSLFLRCGVVPEFSGEVEFQSGLNGYMENEGLLHWEWLDQGEDAGTLYLLNQTRHSHIRVGTAMQFSCTEGAILDEGFWNVQNSPFRMMKIKAIPDFAMVVEKRIRVFSSRDTDDVLEAATGWFTGWQEAFQDNQQAWTREWERTDVVIEGDDEAQLSLRFNLFQMLIAAPRTDDRVNIGAKTLSGFGYRGHSFWDTEIFILPLFIYTAPHIARNLLSYRYHLLAGARENARQNGNEGARFPWESADTGTEVTPRFIPDFGDSSRLIRIWTGDIEIHISADIAYAVMQYWKVTGDDAWMIEKGAEIILDTAKFWASRAEWNPQTRVYEYTNVIGPDEYHDHVDNNAFTNYMARWNLQTALQIIEWLKKASPEKSKELVKRLDLSKNRLAKWHEIIRRIYFKKYSEGVSEGLIEQFEGYFERRDVNLSGLEPRDRSVQVIFGIEGTSETQVLKQPDVLMLQYLMRSEFSDQEVLVNYNYYTPRTDHTFGSSLGPSIQAIMACEVGRIDEAYDHFIRAVRADLRDIRGNAGDGIHAASAAGTWQVVVFGFAGLKIHEDGWTYSPRLPKHWRRLAFQFFYKGEKQLVDINTVESTVSTRPIHAFIFDLDGVLTDTAEFHFLAWKRLADEEGIPFTRDDNEALRGISRRESLNLLLKGRQISETQAEEWMERKNNNYREMILQMTKADLLPGALDLLVELHQAGIKIAIASASKNASDVIERLGLMNAIDVLCDGNSVQRAKPAPDLFLYAARQLGVAPEYCVVVEDAEAGIEAAIHARMHSIGLGPHERVGNADLILPDLKGQKLEMILNHFL